MNCDTEKGEKRAHSIKRVQKKNIYIISWRFLIINTHNILFSYDIKNYKRLVFLEGFLFNISLVSGISD